MCTLVMGLPEAAAPHGSAPGSPCGMGWEVGVLSVGSPEQAVHPETLPGALCQSQAQVMKAIQSCWGGSGSPQRSTAAKFPMFAQDFNFQDNSQK